MYMCSIVYSAEGVEMLHLKLKHLLNLKMFTLIGQMPLDLLMAVLRKSLNLTMLEIDSDDSIQGDTVVHLIQGHSSSFYMIL